MERWSAAQEERKHGARYFWNKDGRQNKNTHLHIQTSAIQKKKSSKLFQIFSVSTRIRLSMYLYTYCIYKNVHVLFVVEGGCIYVGNIQYYWQRQQHEILPDSTQEYTRSFIFFLGFLVFHITSIPKSESTVAYRSHTLVEIIRSLSFPPLLDRQRAGAYTNT